jgi:hypothetical protein
MDTFKFPIRFRQGEVEKWQEDTDEYYSHLLALSLQIMPGELPINPQFGIEDPTFNESLTRDLAFTAGAFIPEIIVSTASITTDSAGQTKINIDFSRRN